MADYLLNYVIRTFKTTTGNYAKKSKKIHVFQIRLNLPTTKFKVGNIYEYMYSINLLQKLKKNGDLTLTKNVLRY